MISQKDSTKCLAIFQFREPWTPQIGCFFAFAKQGLTPGRIKRFLGRSLRSQQIVLYCVNDFIVA